MGRSITLEVVLLLIGGMAVAYSGWTETGRVGKPLIDIRGATVNPRGALRTADRDRGFDPPSASVLGHFDQAGDFLPAARAAGSRRL
jgi:hypothetical protein